MRVYRTSSPTPFIYIALQVNIISVSYKRHSNKELMTHIRGTNIFRTFTTNFVAPLLTSGREEDVSTARYLLPVFSLTYFNEEVGQFWHHILIRQVMTTMKNVKLNQSKKELGYNSSLLIKNPFSM